MIRFIAALDANRGIANDNGIPWQGKIPTDVKYFRDKTINTNLMMGLGWYHEQIKPLPDRRNFVANPDDMDIRDGFEQVKDARDFLKNFAEDIWVGGGAGLFASTLDLADELYLTRLQADFDCSKFFPNFEDQFEMTSESDSITESNITFTFQKWTRKSIIASQ